MADLETRTMNQPEETRQLETITPAREGLILITGSGGLIGQHLVQALAPHYRVVGLDLHPPEPSASEDEWIQCDLTKDRSVTQALQTLHQHHGGQLASVIHLAAHYDFSGAPSPLYQDLTVDGTSRLLKGLQGFEVEQFVFASSLLVMRPVPEGGPRLTEDAPTRAEWAYPQSKLAAESVIREQRKDIPAVILRLAGVYDEMCHSIPISQQIRRIYEKQLEGYVYPGDTTHGQPFIHLQDVAGCVRRVVELREELNPLEVFLVAESVVLSYARLQEKLGRMIHGLEWPSVRIPKALAKAGAWLKDKLPGQDPFIKPWMVDLADDEYPVNLRRARERLDWSPRHYLEDSLEDMVRNLIRDPAAWYEANNLPVCSELEAEGKP